MQMVRLAVVGLLALNFFGAIPGATAGVDECVEPPGHGPAEQAECVAQATGTCDVFRSVFIEAESAPGFSLTVMASCHGLLGGIDVIGMCHVDDDVPYCSDLAPTTTGILVCSVEGVGQWQCSPRV